MAKKYDVIVVGAGPVYGLIRETLRACWNPTTSPNERSLAKCSPCHRAG